MLENGTDHVGVTFPWQGPHTRYLCISKGSQFMMSDLCYQIWMRNKEN